MKILKDYYNSFTFNKKFWRTFIIDVVAILLIIVIFLSLSSIIEKTAYDISGGKSVDELKFLLLTGTEEGAKEFLSNITSFVYTLIAGLLVAVTISLVLFSLSRNLIWSTILEQKFNLRKFWRWNLLNIVLIVFFAVYITLYLILRTVLNSFFKFTTETKAVIYSNSLNAFFFLIFIIFLFLTYYIFSHKNKVWETIGATFHLMKVKFGLLSKTFIFIVTTGIILSLIIYFIKKSSVLLPSQTTMFVEIIILLLFLAWARIYLVKSMK